MARVRTQQDKAKTTNIAEMAIAIFESLLYNHMCAGPIFNTPITQLGYSSLCTQGHMCRKLEVLLKQ